MRPHFFLSYARVDGQDAYVRRFYDDLCEALVALGEPDQEPATGFLDSASLRLGEDWSDRLEEALSRCRTMIALYSPAYFRSSWCSREASVVMGREALYRERTRLSSSALIPVLWDPVDVPTDIAHIQYLTDGMGAWYGDAGLRRILQQDPSGSDYRGAVRMIAERIAEVVRHEDLPVVRPTRLRSCPLSFQPRTGPSRPGASVQFYVAAGAPTMPAHRRDTPYYGRTPMDWNPYHPQDDHPLYQQAQRIVTNQGYGTSYHEVRPGLARQLENAWQSDQVTVILVDAWSAQEAPYRRQFELLDQSDHPATGVLVPCHPAADRSRDELWLGVTLLFQRKSSRGPLDEQFRTRVGYDEFKKALERMVASAQSNLIRRRSIGRPQDLDGSGPPGGRPILVGPSSQPRTSASDREEEQDGGGSRQLAG